MPYIIKFWRGFEEKKISEDKIQSLNYVYLDNEDNINNNPNESVRFSYLLPNFNINTI